MTADDLARFLAHMEAADEAMQAAVAAAPPAASKATNDTFREVRATLAMAHEMQHDDERKGR